MWVIYLDIDSLRPDHLGCYGYGRNTSPNIDKLAKDGIRFSRCFTSDSPCMPSRAALISGMHGIKNGIVTHNRGAFADQLSTLPFVLRSHRIPSVAISSFGRHPSEWFYVGWNQYIDPIDRPELSFQQVDGQQVMDNALKWIDTHRDLPDVYMHIQMWDPHSVYEAPESFIDLVQNDVYPTHPTPQEFERHVQEDFYHSPRTVSLNTYDDWKRMIDEYDAEIRYADYQVGRLLSRLEGFRGRQDVMVILAADHGEEQGEHGLYIEHWSVHNGTQQIPLIVHDSRRSAHGVSFDGGVLQLDIAATVCDAFGITHPEHWDSRSLLQQVDDAARRRTHLVCGHGLYTAQRAVITPEWKFIRTYHPGIWSLPALQLFRSEDKWELEEVSEDHHDVVMELDHQLRVWEEEHRTGIDPMMVNAAEGPTGYLPAKRFTDSFRNGTVSPMRYFFTARKPDPLPHA